MGLLRSRDSKGAGSNKTVASLPDKKAFHVQGIPFQDGSEFNALEQYAGQIPMNDDGKDVMFFWLVTNTTNTQNKDKLVLWLNGGPGCTSLDGVFLENGPYKFDGPNRLRFRDYSFSQQFDVLYIDQPFGTGFSVANARDYMTSFKNATQSLVTFLTKFYSVFPEYRQRQLYISGESEAGTYLPYLADAILKMPEGQRFNLSGVLIGNGWIDPYPMYMSYVELLRQKDMLVPHIQKKMIDQMDLCARQYKKAPQPVHVEVCEEIPGIFIEQGGPTPNHCYNQYDLRLTDTQPACGMNWPPEIGMYNDYLNRKNVQGAINIKDGMAPAIWTECSSQVNRMLKDDSSSPASTLLENILNHIPILLFVGDADFLCNYVGIEWMIGNLTWAGSKGLSSSAKSIDWKINGAAAGKISSDRGLTYVRIYNASHMVGVDKPREMLDLFTEFTNSSASNLHFVSSLRSGNQKIELPPPKPPRIDRPSMGKWIGIGFALLVFTTFLMCFLRRRQLFAWWHSRKAYRPGGMQRPDGDGLVASRGPRHRRFNAADDDGSSGEMDDAFMMSEFAFKRNRHEHDSFDVEGLLLDDDAASSFEEEADDDGAFTKTSRSTGGRKTPASK